MSDWFVSFEYKILKNFLGVGINVANSKPTVCINDMLPQGARKLDVEEVLALVMSKFESMQNAVQMDLNPLPIQAVCRISKCMEKPN